MILYKSAPRTQGIKPRILPVVFSVRPMLRPQHPPSEREPCPREVDGR